ncbi:thioredoxin family protein [Dethiosulfatarculus sandiegensis]|uniref:Thioredoxin n=1 Tax=Dethiosulfatarculus sandiegensis TaxID=1429043 RepID=A0A0D2G8X0_9BACT|nr:thioredoxin domain-containing protein [Dethiosulfatarculus sandiegensis]KIX11352.1 thioredoxin [Dethiosulfatarculus sandiegensis]
MGNGENVVCPGCQSINNVPGEKLGDAPKCGNCGEPILDAKPVELDEGGFERHKTKETLPFLVDFYAPWCGHCRQMSPNFDKAAETMAPDIRFAKVSTEAAQALAGKLGIKSIPTLVLFKGGKELARNSGVMDPDAIVKWVKGNL